MRYLIAPTRDARKANEISNRDILGKLRDVEGIAIVGDLNSRVLIVNYNGSTDELRENLGYGDKVLIEADFKMDPLNVGEATGQDRKTGNYVEPDLTHLPDSLVREGHVPDHFIAPLSDPRDGPEGLVGKIE